MKRLICLLLSAAMILLPAAAYAGGVLVCTKTEGNGSPYYLMVNRSANTVTVYGLGEDGCYSVPIRSMICSCGRSGHGTPLGTSRVSDRYEWRVMVDGTYAQYAVRFNGKILFHSVCYRKAEPSALITSEYNALGTHASLGCVRLQTSDAAWIWEHCPKGTLVTVYDSESPGPLGTPDRLVPQITEETENGWDPSDPRPENPWHAVLGERAGISSALNGLPFRDVTLRNWYYHEVLDVCRAGLMRGTASDRFSPSERLTDAMALQLLFNMEVSEGNSDAARASMPGVGDDWFTPAMRWAESAGIRRAADPISDPNAPVQRQLFVLYLYRWLVASRSTVHDYILSQPSEDAASETLAAFIDAERVSPICLEAIVWAVENNLLKGYNGALQPMGSLTRAEAAALLQRFRAAIRPKTTDLR